ncbi:hypothetical protein CMO92_04410 [Candidatus Woesearchaeota archaeon]|nr:hypothetical protein [Candidatus Woesearchaeota archaeon]
MDLYKSFVRDMTSFGSSYFLAGLIIFCLYIDRNLAVLLLVAFLISLGIVYLLKKLFFVPRPVPDKPKNFIERIDASSFPSAHSSRAAIFGLQLALWFQDLIFTVLIVIFSLLICWSRIELKRHRLIDVVVGGGIGLGSVGLAHLLIPYLL